MEPTFRAARCTASASVTSILRGTKPLPNSLCKRSASVCLRTEPNTRNPFETSTFVVPQPIPVETPVTTTSLLFAIAFLLRYCSTFLAAARVQSVNALASIKKIELSNRVRAQEIVDAADRQSPVTDCKSH